MTFPQSMNPVPSSEKFPAWFYAFVLLLAVLPLPFGSNRPWASNLCAVLAGGLLSWVIYTMRHDKTDNSKMPRRRLSFSLFGFSFVVIWSFFQVMPWAPEAWHHPIWIEAEKVIGPINGSISIDTGAFPEALLRLVSYAAFFVTALYAGRDPNRAAWLVRAMTIIGVVYAFYGLFIHSTGSEMILWFKKWAYKESLTSTFVNKNSYATYAGLGLLCSFAYVWQQFSKQKPVDHVLAKRSKLLAFLSSRDTKDYASTLLPLVLMAALVLTGSRAGIASSAAGVLVFFIAMAFFYKWNTVKWGLMVGSFAIVFLLFLAMGGGHFLDRIGETQMGSDTQMRIAGYQIALQAIHDNPWLGFGLGTFDAAFRLYRDASLSLWFHHAHNDYLEMIMDLGFPVAFILFASVLSLVSCCITGLLQRRRHGVYPALALGASAIVGVHGFADFSLHIPAVAATYSAFLGLGVAQSWSSKTEKRS